MTANSTTDTTTTTNFDIFAAMAALDLDKSRTLYPVADGEKIVGEASEGLWRSYCLSWDLAAEADNIDKQTEALRISHNDVHATPGFTRGKVCDEYDHKLVELQTLRVLLLTRAAEAAKIYSAALGLEFADVINAGEGSTGMGLRENRKVVVAEKSDRPNFDLDEILSQFGVGIVRVTVRNAQRR